ncbi:uncharacterized protein [Amphiura filiformis]|uniref:uncharacterized protein n=1 Tax=Amphiura filiformis TaxID=82378 RepID=UPI003B224A21
METRSRTCSASLFTLIIVLLQVINSLSSKEYYIDKQTENLQVRLTGGDTNYVGLVEVYLNGEWGGICNTVDRRVADTVCRSIDYADGYDYAEEIFDNANSMFNIWPDEIFMSGLDCSSCGEDGDESCYHLSECDFRELEDTGCPLDAMLGLHCEYFDDGGGFMSYTWIFALVFSLISGIVICKKYGSRFFIQRPGRGPQTTGPEQLTHTQASLRPNSETLPHIQQQSAVVDTSRPGPVFWYPNPTMPVQYPMGDAAGISSLPPPPTYEDSRNM